MEVREISQCVRKAMEISETFRTKIYYKEKEAPIERIPVSRRMINFKDSEENKGQVKTKSE